MRFGFLLKRGKPEAQELAQSLATVLAGRGATVVALAEDAGQALRQFLRFGLAALEQEAETHGGAATAARSRRRS